MINIVSANAEGQSFISKDKIKILTEMKDLCYFPDTPLRNAFIIQVSYAAGCEKFEDIKECDFGSAFLTAKLILQKVGENIWSPSDEYFNVLLKVVIRHDRLVAKRNKKPKVD